MPTRDVVLRQQLSECKVIEDDENIHSRLQRQINLLSVQVQYLLREVKKLQDV